MLDDLQDVSTINYEMEHPQQEKTSQQHPQEERPDQHPQQEWFGYKFVGDNIDKNIKPRYQRQDHRGLSLHYFHGFGVLDRVNMSKLSDISPSVHDRDFNNFLLSKEDIKSLKEELEILVSRYAKF